jgi:hypothetical protein
MTDPIDPAGPISPLGPPERRRRDAATSDAGAETTPALPVPVGPPAAEPEPRRPAIAAFVAQLLSGGQRRGLRGGPETLERARATYLETEWSGPSDRRVRRGRITKTQV